MKTLIIVRHAKSSWSDPDLEDQERPLNKRGQKDAPRMAKRLKEKNITPDLMLSSPAKRAMDTCMTMANIIQYKPGNVRTAPELYHATEDEIFDIIHELKDNFKTVMIFGHNPGLTDFVNRLTKENIFNIPTCGVAFCQLDVDSWSKVKWGQGKLSYYDFPKSKD